ncbi:asparagine synthase-related protein [Streptomyces boninensis]|uniref:asparagine synthase-related protein n=1 Tax=Streptomyces boninensis TaxID=2039455 RepID=UPI003B20E9E2
MTERTGFIVLPDRPDGVGTDDAYPFTDPQVIRHDSGRPWIVGSWGTDDVLQAANGPVRVVVIGSCPVTTGRLTGLCRHVRTPADLNILARELPGSFHLIAAVGDEVRVQGSLSGLRQVFHTRTGDLPIAADRADALAAMTGAGLDEETLATRVVCGGKLPPPLADRSGWHGVATVPHDHWLRLTADSAREVRWWQPPEPELGLADGAARLRAALLGATDGRYPEDDGLSSDLSGGMDSTSLCFLAARHRPGLLTFRWAEADAANDDSYYAAAAAKALPEARHLVIPQAELPPIFTDSHLVLDPERPYLFPRSQARMRYTARLLSEHRARSHIAGHGADELFTRFPGYLHRLARRHPLIALRHLRGHRALERWPLGGVLAQLARQDTAGGWLRSQAEQLRAPGPNARTPSLSWGLRPLRAPAWATSEAVEAARQTLWDAARHVQPYAADRGQHQFLSALRTTAPAYRQVARIFAAEGVRLHQPYLDDRVVEAALGVTLHERATPWRYKPLLAAALRGLVPDTILDRTTKGDFSADLRTGQRRNRPALAELFSGSALAGLGLISEGAVRDSLLAPHADTYADLAVEQLVGCETWARTAIRPSTTAGSQLCP